MKRNVVKVLAVLAVAALAACTPKFPEGSAIDVEADADSVQLSWPEAQPVNAEAPIVAYQVWVNGEVVWELNHEQPRSCDLVGLEPNVEAEIWVRAVDDAGTGSNLLKVTVDGPPETSGDGDPYCAIGLPPIEM